MTIAIILLNYFKLGLLVMASYFLWDAATSIQSRFNKGMEANFQLRIARLVFLSALLMPLMVVLFSIQSPTFELIPTQGLQIESEPKGLAIVSAIALILIVGISINLYRFTKEFTKLQSILRESSNLKRLGKVRILYNSNIKIPFATGLFRTKIIVLPEELILNRENLSIVLKHEGHHIRMGDLYWSIFARIVSIVFFWNPAAYAWKRDLHDLQEFACDQYVTSHVGISRKAYANCLFHVAAYESYEQYTLVTPMSLWRGGLRIDGPNLKNRIDSLYYEKKYGAQVSPAGFALSGMVIVSILCFGERTQLVNVTAADVNPGNFLQDADSFTSGSIQEPVLAPGFQPDPHFGRLIKKPE